MHPAIAVAHACLANRLDAGFEAGLVGAAGFVVKTRSVHFQNPASPQTRMKITILASASIIVICAES